MLTISIHYTKEVTLGGEQALDARFGKAPIGKTYDRADPWLRDPLFENLAGCAIS